MTYPLFQGAGLYLYNPEVGMDQRTFVRNFKNAGGTWMAFLLQEAKSVINNPKNQQLMDICRQEGIKVVGSSWLQDDPVEEAKISKSLAVNLDGWIANGEQPVTYSQPWGFCASCFQYSSTWMNEWGMMRETMFSSYTHFHLHDIDYAPFVLHRCAAGPQAYINDFGPDYGPDSAISGAYDVKQPWNGYRGFEANYIAPVGGIAFSRYAVDLPDWFSRLANAREQYPGKGFSFWPGELFNNIPNGWSILEAAIHQRGLARYPGEAPQLEPPLTEIQLPFTGPYYGPTSDKPPRKGPTAKALKLTMMQGGFGTFAPDPDIYYNLALEQAVRRFQHAVGITPARGDYGKGVWQAIRKYHLPNGKIIVPDLARQIIKLEASKR